MSLKTVDAKRGFYLMMFVNYALQNGQRFKEFDKNLFTVDESADFNNYFVAYIIMCEATRLYDLGEIDEAIALYDVLNLDKIQTFYSSNIRADIMYYYIIHKPDFEKANEIFQNKGVKRYLKCGLPTTFRILAAYDFFICSDSKKAEKNLKQAMLSAINYPNVGIKLMEMDYISELKNTMIIIEGVSL